MNILPRHWNAIHITHAITPLPTAMQVTSYAKALTLFESGQLHLYDITLDTQPSIPGRSTTMVLMGGSTGDGAGLDMSGIAPDIRMWDADCTFPQHGINLGIAPVKTGEMLQMEMAKQGAAQMPWVLFSANDDALCIAWAGVSWPDLSAYVWVGDWARACGRDWYYSNTFLQGTNHKPPCQWMDLDGERPETGFSLHWPSFTMDPAEVPTNKTHIDRIKHHICQGPPYESHTDRDPRGLRCNPDYEFPDWTDDSLWNCDGSRRTDGNYLSDDHCKYTNNTEPELGAPPTRGSQAHDSSLVITDDPAHSAEELCAHRTSRGPNLVNTHGGNYCHMVDKSIWPVCSSKTASDCFDKDAQLLMVEGVSKRDTQYKKIIDWTGNSNNDSS